MISLRAVLPLSREPLPHHCCQAQRMLVTSSHHSGPCALRIPRGEGEGVPLAEEGFEPLEIGRGELLTDGESDIVLVSEVRTEAADAAAETTEA